MTTPNNETTNNQATLPQVQTLQQTDPAVREGGDGQITDQVAPEEESLVLDMLENYDAPSSDELLEEQQVFADAPAPLGANQQQDTGQTGVPQVPAQQPVVQGQPEQVVNQQIPGQVPGQPGQQPVPAQSQQPQGQQATQQPAVPAQTPAVNPIEALRASVEAQREQFIEVAARSYQETFTEADVEEFVSDPRAALSKMGARLHFDIVQNTLGMVAQQMPQMMAGLMQTQQVHKTEEDAFYQQHSDLSNHRAQVVEIARVYRQLNPQMPAEQFKSNLANLARMQLNIQPQQQQPVQTQQVPQQQQRPTAFKPAGATVPARPAPQAPQGGNPWALTDMIMEADAQGQLDERYK